MENTTDYINENATSPTAITDEYYKYLVPLMFVFCFVSIIVNLRVLLAVHWIRRPLSPTLHISLSLAAADVFTSAHFCIALLINSYLPKVYGIEVATSVALAVEIARMSGVIITVIHLLALSITHWMGILKPLHYTTMVTTNKIVIVIIMLWVIPIAFFNTYFIANGAFLKDELPEFLNLRQFRYVFSSLFFVPLILMVFCYGHILFMVRRQQEIWAKLSRAGSKRSKGFNKSSGQQRRTMEGNVKAVYTTLLILGSSIIGWLPAVLLFMLVCRNCIYERVELDHRIQFCISWLINTLVILKTLANPIIYSARMVEIKDGMARMKFAATRIFCTSRRERYASNLQPLQLGYSGSMNAGMTALCKLNGSICTKPSIRSNYPNTLV